jgi:hypothetical protein
MAEIVEQSGGRTQFVSLGGFEGGEQDAIESLAFLIVHVVALIVHHQMEHCAIREGRRFIQHEAAILDVRAQVAHEIYCTAFSPAAQTNQPR